MNRILFVLLSFVLTVSSLLVTDYRVGAKESNRMATVLYFNDAHEISPVVNQYGNRGGVARLKTVIDRVEKKIKRRLLHLVVI